MPFSHYSCCSGKPIPGRGHQALVTGLGRALASLLLVITAELRAASSFVSVRMDDGSAHLVFSGPVGEGHDLYRAATVLGPWQKLTSQPILMPEEGVASYDDRTAPGRGAFYRLGVRASTPVGSEGLAGYWPLDGDWRDVVGGHNMIAQGQGGFSPAAQLRGNDNRSYGPTKSDTGNGGRCAGLTGVVETNGVTLEGWVWLPDDSSSGLLFGFGARTWDQPNLSVTAAWGFIWVYLGREGDGAVVQYPRIGDTCWHHLALVLPKGFRDGVPFRFYLDGAETPNIAIDSSRSGGASLTKDATLFGSPFGIGEFNEGYMRVDEVRLWERELSAAEIAAVAKPRGVGPLCENAPPPNWAPGPRFSPPQPEPRKNLVLGVHVLTDDTIAVITDPNPFLKQRIQADCGAYLRAMENNLQYLPAWFPPSEYDLATWDVIIHYRTAIFEALAKPDHFSISGPDASQAQVSMISLWPQATREFRTPSFAEGGSDVHTTSSENVYYTFLKLAKPMENGVSYRVEDAWGNATSWTYDEHHTISWALKVNQLGYLSDAPQKFAYLGSWLGASGGPLSVARFVGKPFSVCREADDTEAFQGIITFRGDESTPTHGVILSGEIVCELDFSPLTTPGRYYVRVPGMGRSWAFEIGQNAMGEAFYTYLRSLYHQRCGTQLPADFTAWPRGDAHTNTFKDLLPTEFDAFTDHSAQGWGLLDTNGRYPTNFHEIFQIVADTATTNLVPELRGGWHDAGDFDREGAHLRVVEDLVESFLLFPENFTDAQADIPESGNGLPDILDEAVWGVEVWRRAQEPDGRVALTIEATSHPQIADPAKDTQPYYLGLATHNSSLLYAEHAARLARGLTAAGASNVAALYLESARRAYAFGTRDTNRIVTQILDPDGLFSWMEPPQIDPGARAKALVQLWLASGDPGYYREMDTPDCFHAFKGEVDSLYWRTFAFDFIDAALAPERFPDGWGTLAHDAILSNAEGWLRWQQAHAHRKLWYAPGEGYFSLMGWGNNDFVYIRNLVAAWRLSADPRFRAGALTAVDWMHGANPQGRVNTTGLGQNFVVNPLHLPSDSDGIDEAVPGICIYGYSFGILFDTRTKVFGLFASPDPGRDFSGAALAQMPPPWNNPGMSIAEIGDILYAHMPTWRNLWALEAANPPQMEFTVTETQGPAVAVTGCLLGPGWKPPTTLRHRKPRTDAELQDSRWFHP